MCKTLFVGLVLLAHVTGGVAQCTVDDFDQEKQEEDGVFCNCQHLDKAFGLDLEACMNLTCEVGGNAFNFRISDVFITQCYPKRCCGPRPVYAYNPIGYEVYLHKVAYHGCPVHDVGTETTEIVVSADLAEENTGSVKADGCKFRAETHAPGESWIQGFKVPDKHKECVCPDPLPETWSVLTSCRGICFVGDAEYYGGDRYERVIDGVKNKCRCNTHGRERCRRPRKRRQ